MALKLNERYPQRWDSPSNDYPQGAFKNLSEIGEQDGSYLEQDWLNDYSGFFGALLRNAEMTPNGLVDTAQRSQFYDALVQVARNIVAENPIDLSAYFKKADVAQEWGDSPDKVLSQEFLSNRVRQYPTLSDYASINDVIQNGAYVNFNKEIVEVSEKPNDIYGFNGYLKHGSILYPQDLTLKTDVSKITNQQGYTAWAQDKAYVMGSQIKVWLNHGDAHLDGQLIPAYIISEDGGSSWSDLYLPFGLLTGHTCWSAGFDGEYEYVIVRKESDLSNTVYRRKPDFGTSYNELKPWEKLDSSFPRPSAATNPDNKLIMIHSFTTGRNGSVVVGAHYGSQWVGGFESIDKGVTWSYFTLDTSSVRSEPTIKYDPKTDKYYGFIRNGAEAGNPMFFSAVDLNSPVKYSAPTNIFGAAMSSTPVPLYVDDGKIWAFVGFRNGRQEGRDDIYASQFYITADISNGDNIWNTANIISLGDAKHLEDGGASALSVGSIVKYGSKLMIFSGTEERTGTSPTPTSNTNVNRIANIQMTSIIIGNDTGIMSEVSGYRNLRSASNCTYKFYDGKNMQPIGLPVYRRFKDLSSSYEDLSNHACFDFGSSSGGVACTTTGSFISFTGNGSGLRVDTTVGVSNLVDRDGNVYSFRKLNITPRADGVSDLGSSALTFKTVFLTNQPTVVSDERKKKDITDITDYLKVAEKLQFKQFKMDHDDNIHFGIIAQDWIKACENCGVDPYESGVLVGGEEEGYAIRYGELQNLFNAYILERIK